MGTRQYRFRYTAKNLPSIITLALIIPGGLVYLGYQSQVSKSLIIFESA